jgi:hypothetical protein
MNKRLVLISGESAGGKSASLHSMTDPEGILYLNCESGKDLPFASKFKELAITDPHMVPKMIEHVEQNEPRCHGIVIDTLTFLMDMYESVYVLGPKCPRGQNGPDTMKAWGRYAQFFKNLMQDQVAKSTRNVIFMAHSHAILDEENMVMSRKVPVKGHLAKNGIEAYFSVVLAAKKVSVSDLADFENDLLTITPEEEAIGVKYVFQTRLTKDTVNDRIRSPMGLWSANETYIDNNVQQVMDRLGEYYK